MDILGGIIFLLCAVVASSIFDKFLPRLSLPLVQIGLGVIITLFWGVPTHDPLEFDLLLILFIAPLHFNESRHVDSGALWKHRWGILSLSVGLVILVALCVGFLLNAMIPAIPFAIAYALGAALGSTDAPAVTELSKGFKFEKRHKALLTGEALFNDVTGTVLFKSAVAFTVSATYSLSHIGKEFALDLFGGMFGGALMGIVIWVIMNLLRKFGIRNPTVHVTLELLFPFIIFFVAEALHIGSVIAVVSAGLVFSLIPSRHTVETAQQRIQSTSVWNTLEFILNGIIFVILGMQLPKLFQEGSNANVAGFGTLLAATIAVLLTIELVRFIWILGMDAFNLKREGKEVSTLFTVPKLKEALAMAFAGSKGGVTLALVLTLPLTLGGTDITPLHNTVVSVASGVILGTILLANFGVPLLVPSKNEKMGRKRADIEVKMLNELITTLRANIKQDGIDKLAKDDTHYLRYYAAVVVLNDYAEQLNDLLPQASKQTAKSVEETVRQVSEMYNNLELVDLGSWYYEEEGDEKAAKPAKAAKKRVAKPAKAAEEHIAKPAQDAEEHIAKSDEDAEEHSPAKTLTILDLHDEIESAKSQALNIELGIIKRMRKDGELTADHAKELRNNVYVQELVL